MFMVFCTWAVVVVGGGELWGRSLRGVSLGECEYLKGGYMRE